MLFSVTNGVVHLSAESFIESPKVTDNMVRYHYVDVLFSQKDGQFYAGCTQNVLKRLEQHNSGQIRSTKRQLATGDEI